MEQEEDPQQRQAEDWTAGVARQIKVLDQILVSALRRKEFSFGHLMVTPQTPQFDPGPLGIAAPAPEWGDFAPVRPGLLSRLFRGARYGRQVAAARARFEAARSDHTRQEAERLDALAAAKAHHDKEITEERAKAARRNAYVVAQQAAFGTGNAESVEWFVTCVLAASLYPEVFPRENRVVYRPENRDVVVEFELPPRRIVPTMRAFRYARTRDAVEPVPRPENEVKQRYKRLICAIALRTLHEIFSATQPDVVAAVVFNGRASTVDPATGKPIRPHLLSLAVDRPAFDDLVLADVEPIACVTHLNGLLSPNPYGLEAVQPFMAFDPQRFRLAEGTDVIAGLESRPNLLKVSAAEFEHLLRQLFVAMGAEGWTALPAEGSRMSAVVTSKSLFSDGACLLQAESSADQVGLESVHVLTEAMSDHNATAGVLVTTSWFSEAGEQFARRNRITLINGAELGQLIKKHLNRDVLHAQPAAR
ncbi:MAG: restriction endonuclease [Streptosporangiaceae bacterium]|nr:restriction endonuclease [Streptosporangiaceae bacterium]